MSSPAAAAVLAALAPDLEPAGSSAFVPPPLLVGFLSDDRVEVALTLEPDGRLLAGALSLISRSRTEVFGELSLCEGAPVLVPDPFVGASPIPLVAPSKAGFAPVSNPAALSGSGVLALAATAELAAVAPMSAAGLFADPLAPDTLRARVLHRHGLTSELPAALAAAATDALAQRAQQGPALATLARRDLTSLTAFTIDADSSRDLDDAISVLAPDARGGLRVLVHIADVAEHVLAGSVLDQHAAATATSVYLPGLCVPMLPPSLSEAALSLLPGQVRNTISVEMRINPEGLITSVDVFASQIRSAQRLSYESAALVLAGTIPDDVLPEVADSLARLRTAGARLSTARAARGGVESRRIEPELTIKASSTALEPTLNIPQNAANELIERLMVAANESVATWLLERAVPGVFRNHGAPAPEAAAELELFANKLGLFPALAPELTPLGLAALAAQLHEFDPTRAGAMWDVLLGHLGRAAYEPECSGHFGLGSAAYLHFTSPLRRYADLLVHRSVRAYLAGERDVSAFASSDSLAQMCARMNEAAATAKRAESQVRRSMWLTALESAHREDPSAIHPARITGFSARGVFVQLEASLVSGVVVFRDLAGRWEPDVSGQWAATPEGARLEIGSELLLRIKSIDVLRAELELVPDSSDVSDARVFSRAQRPARPSGARSAPRSAPRPPRPDVPSRAESSPRPPHEPAAAPTPAPSRSRRRASRPASASSASS